MKLLKIKVILIEMSRQIFRKETYSGKQNSFLTATSKTFGQLLIILFPVIKQKFNSIINKISLVQRSYVN